MEILVFVLIDESPTHSFINFSKFRGEIYAREIYQEILQSGWIFFEEPNLKGIIIGHIEICRGEISYMMT